MQINGKNVLTMFPEGSCLTEDGKVHFYDTRRHEWTEYVFGRSLFVLDEDVRFPGTEPRE